MLENSVLSLTAVVTSTDLSADQRPCLQNNGGCDKNLICATSTTNTRSVSGSMIFLFLNLYMKGGPTSARTNENLMYNSIKTWPELGSC